MTDSLSQQQAERRVMDTSGSPCPRAEHGWPGAELGCASRNCPWWLLPEQEPLDMLQRMD
jgi:hypothetical protein